MGGVAFALLLAAASSSPEQVLADVRATYLKAGDLKADFTQVYVDKLRGKKRKESGKLWATADGRVRWSYLQPVRKDFVYDGKNAYFYEPDNAQVMVFEHFRDSPLSNALKFLWGQGDLKATFDVNPCANNCDMGEKGDLVVELWPKENIPTVDHSLLIVNPKNHRVRMLVVFDPLGNRTEYHFDNIEFGADIPDKKFNFVVPKGVSILRSTNANTPKPK
ncbi:MAG: outer membrane lipoprotein carrier protein LolA [Myxococcota bacterium]